VSRAHRSSSPRHGFTLIELLVVVAITAVLAAILFPVFAQAREKARQAACLSNLRQIGLAFLQYQQDYDEALPDRRDLKTSLPNGYKPWSTWPASDPRGGWAAAMLDPYVKAGGVWECPSVAGAFPDVTQARQASGPATGNILAWYWLWRFDKPDDPVPLDNWWGKTPDQAVLDLREAAKTNATIIPSDPQGPADAELAVDPYFPRTVSSLPADLRGKAVHMGGRNRLFLDGHVKWLRDVRTQ
jgi:prepilin-type N-terminal cleavage/methylation domain-containing protein/prepilin-type processing-associated H-X9-DG protein